MTAQGVSKTRRHYQQLIEEVKMAIDVDLFTDAGSAKEGCAAQGTATTTWDSGVSGSSNIRFGSLPERLA